MDPPSVIARFDEALGAPGQNFRPKANQRGMNILMNYQADGWDGVRQMEALAEKAPHTQPKGVVIFADWRVDSLREIVKVLMDNSHAFQSLEGICLYAPSQSVSQERSDLVGGLLNRFPGLRVLALNLGDWDRHMPPAHELQPVRHISLEALFYSSLYGARSFVQQLSNWVLPQLNCLEIELWRSDPKTVFELRSLLATDFPQLRRLGFHGSHDADYVAAAVVESPLLKQLDSLELSWGWLTDDAVVALLSTPRITQLNQLVLHRHYLSDRLLGKLGSLQVKLVETAADPDDKDWTNVQRHRLMRRVAAEIKGEMRVSLHCLPHYELSVLSEVALEGKVRFWEIDPGAGEFLGEVLENPTWMEVAIEANRLMLQLKTRSEIYLVDVRIDGPDNDLPDVMRGRMEIRDTPF